LTGFQQRGKKSRKQGKLNKSMSGREVNFLLKLFRFLPDSVPGMISLTALKPSQELRIQLQDVVEIENKFKALINKSSLRMERLKKLHNAALTYKVNFSRGTP
jgi:tRNA U34 5-carboxymethylaminomethyl modifying enzyme MnmG/GidA